MMIKALAVILSSSLIAIIGSTPQEYNLVRMTRDTSETLSRHCSADELFDAVVSHYTAIAKGDYEKREMKADCLSNSTHFCEPHKRPGYLNELGYSDKERSLGGNANLGLGCGNPLKKAKLQNGEIVADLGSGTGFDALIASDAVGEDGKVIGVDMTPEMISLARRNAKAADKTNNIEFRLGQIENLPIADSYVNVILSNCAINVLPEAHKAKSMKEAYRVLKRDGRIIISTLLASDEVYTLAKEKKECCYLGVTLKSNLKKYLEDAGFVDIVIEDDERNTAGIKMRRNEDDNLGELIKPSIITARKKNWYLIPGVFPQ